MKRMYSRLPNLMVEKDPKLNQKKLAADLGISTTTVNRLFHGQPMKCRIDPETVAAICNYFNCGVGDLLVLKEDLVS